MTSITWWGHATVTVRDSGVRVLTDPLLTRRVGHLRRRRGAVPPPEAVQVDLVLVSHLHADHLHVPSLAKLLPGTGVVIPRGSLRAVPGLRRLRSLEFVEAVPGVPVRVGSLLVTAVPAAHDGRRWPVGPQRVPALGYVVRGESTTYFAGDTTLYDGMGSAVGPCDIALLPVGGWGPNLGPGHLDARGAARLLELLAPRYAVPIHYGTLWPVGMTAIRPHEFHTPGQEFARHAAQYAPGVEVRQLGHAESAHLDPQRPLPSGMPGRGPAKQ